VLIWSLIEIQRAVITIETAHKLEHKTRTRAKFRNSLTMESCLRRHDIDPFGVFKNV
jgi:hypothetical protein